MASRNDTPISRFRGAAPMGSTPVRTTLAQRMWARLFASRYDDQVERGVMAVPGTPLAIHRQRLTSRRERADLAQALTVLLEDAGHLPRPNDRMPRVPIHADAVRGSAEAVDDVRARLLGPLPVRARGMARLRILLGDGRGPTYRAGRGTFASAIRGVLAAL